MEKQLSLKEMKDLAWPHDVITREMAARLPNIIVLVEDRGFLCVVSQNSNRTEATVKYFLTEKEAVGYWHDVSLDAHPQWHAENCPTCKNKIIEDLLPPVATGG